MTNRFKDDLDLGERVVRALVGLDSRHVKVERAAFVALQRALEAADNEVFEANARVEGAARTLAEADQHQEAGVEALASQLVADGFDRFNPFKTFGARSPARVRALGMVREAHVVQALAKKVLANGRARAESKQVATTLSAAAERVLQASYAHREAVVLRRQSIVQRDSLNAEWQTALTNLRASIRYADLREGTHEYARVFARRATRQTQRRRAKTSVTGAAPPTHNSVRGQVEQVNGSTVTRGDVVPVGRQREHAKLRFRHRKSLERPQGDGVENLNRPEFDGGGEAAPVG